jgi:hypothetical protein
MQLAVDHNRGRSSLNRGATGVALDPSELSECPPFSGAFDIILDLGLPLTSGVHILRRTFCSHLAMRGAPVRTIEALAGHADLSTTMRCMHLSPASLNQAIRLLEQRPPLRKRMGRATLPPQKNTNNSR